MLFLKLNGIVLDKEKIKESDALVYILTKNLGVIKCYLKGIFRTQSKNLGLIQVGNYNRFFLITDSLRFRIVSALPLRIQNFSKAPYIFLWTYKLIKNLKFLETPKFIFFVLLNLEKYIKQNPKNFPFWFLFHLLQELGYGIDLENCFSCRRKLKKFAYFDNKRALFCYYCKKDSYLKIKEKELAEVRKIKNLIKIPKIVPGFLKKMLKEALKNLSYN